MPQHIRVDGAWQEIGARWIRSGGAWRRIRKAWVYADGAWRQYFTGVDPVTATIDPNPLFAFSFNNSTVQGGVSAAITGGLAPFTYSWTVVSYSGALPSITDGATASPTFTQSGVALEAFETAVFRVTVSDNSGQTQTADVSAEFYNQSFS